jgi:hypothetical protein
MVWQGGKEAKTPSDSNSAIPALSWTNPSARAFRKFVFSLAAIKVLNSPYTKKRGRRELFDWFETVAHYVLKPSSPNAE